MSMSDPVGDMLTRIRNAQRARHSVCVAPASKLRENVLGVLKREGFIRGYASEQLRPGVALLRIELKYNEGEPVIKEINRVSKPFNLLAVLDTLNLVPNPPNVGTGLLLENTTFFADHSSP